MDLRLRRMTERGGIQWEFFEKRGQLAIEGVLPRRGTDWLGIGILHRFWSFMGER